MRIRSTQSKIVNVRDWCSQKWADLAIVYSCIGTKLMNESIICNKPLRRFGSNSAENAKKKQPLNTTVVAKRPTKIQTSGFIKIGRRTITFSKHKRPCRITKQKTEKQGKRTTYGNVFNASLNSLGTRFFFLAGAVASSQSNVSAVWTLSTL